MTRRATGEHRVMGTSQKILNHRRVKFSDIPSDKFSSVISFIGILTARVEINTGDHINSCLLQTIAESADPAKKIHASYRRIIVDKRGRSALLLGTRLLFFRSAHKNTAGETLKRLDSAFTWRVLSSRLPFRMADTMLCPPSSSARSVCLRLCSSIK